MADGPSMQLRLRLGCELISGTLTSGLALAQTNRVHVTNRHPPFTAGRLLCGYLVDAHNPCGWQLVYSPATIVSVLFSRPDFAL